MFVSLKIRAKTTTTTTTTKSLTTGSTTEILPFPPTLRDGSCIERTVNVRIALTVYLFSRGGLGPVAQWTWGGAGLPANLCMP